MHLAMRTSMFMLQIAHAATCASGIALGEPRAARHDDVVKEAKPHKGDGAGCEHAQQLLAAGLLRPRVLARERVAPQRHLQLAPTAGPDTVERSMRDTWQARMQP